MSEATSQGRPWHLWVVGIVSLLWNAMGCLDYLMTETKNEAYLKNFTPEQLEFFNAFPAWAVAFWAIAVWGGLLGSVLLLLRKGLAAPVFLVSLLAMLVTTFQNFVLTNGYEVMGTFGVVFGLVIFVISVFLVVYASKMKGRGVLV